MFSNGTEYIAFQERNCDHCSFYVHWEDATADNPTCQIEEAIAECAATGEGSYFPYEWLDETGTMARYSCRKRLGFDKK